MTVVGIDVSKVRVWYCHEASGSLLQRHMK